MPLASASPVLQYIRDRVRPNSLADLPDSQLLDRFISSRDEQAFALIVNRHGPMVFAVCRRKLGRVHDAEDAFQATFLVLARKAASIRHREMLSSWLYGVACRTATKAQANARKRRAREQPMANLVEPQIPAGELCPDLRPILDEEVCRLPAKYRAAFILCCLEGKSTEEAARGLGCPKGTVHSRLAWARQRLRSRLTRRGVALPAAVFTTLLARQAASAVVPTVLVSQTTKAAILFALGEAAAGGAVSAPVLILTRGVLHAMLATKLTVSAVVLLTLALFGGVGVLISPRIEASPVAVPGDSPPSDAEPSTIAVFDESTAGTETAAAANDEAGKSAPKEPANPKHSRGHAEVKELVTKTFKTGSSPRLIVELYNGGVNVVAKADRTINARVTKQGSGESDEVAREALKRVDLKMTQEGETVRIVATEPEEFRREESRHTGSSGASAEIEVPTGAALELHTSNGPVTITGGTGQANVKTSNGPIRVTDNAGALTLHTSNGSVRVQGGKGQIDLATTNGRVELQAEQALVKARTSNGSMTFQGSLAKGAHTLATSNGNIVVTLPSGTGFEIDADTTHGRITTDFPNSENKVETKRRTHLHTQTTSNPAISLKAHTSNGNIDLRESK
jgi:RNA polymerase sigma factor (sigma-70 family)